MIKTYFDNIKEAIIEEMIVAEQSVWLASSYFADRSIFKLLSSLAQRGIDVRLLIADEKINLVQQDLNYGELVAAGGRFYLANRTPYNSLMHHKFCVIDGKKVITGSYNYTLKAQYNRENVVVITSEDIANDYIKEFNYVSEHFAVQMQEWKNRFLPSGFLETDQITGGFHAGELICLSGKTAMGCSSLALNIGYNLSANLNHSVGFISTDLSYAEIGSRYLSIHSKIPLSNIKAGNLEEYEWQTLHMKVPGVEESPFQTYVAETFEQIESKCKAFFYSNVELIIIDKINPFIRDNYYDSTSNILERLKNLARLIRIPILFTYTLPTSNKNKYPPISKRPSIDDLGPVYNYVDTIMFLNRNEYWGIDVDENCESTAGKAEIIIPKSYIGSEGRSILNFERSSLKFENTSEKVEL